MIHEQIFFQFTFYDEMKTLRTEYDHLCLDQKKSSHVEVAHAYFGEHNDRRTMVFKSSTAVTL